MAIRVQPHFSTNPKHYLLQCLVSWRWLTINHVQNSLGTVVCPGPPWTPECAGGETYEVITNSGVIGYFESAAARAIEILDISSPDITVTLIESNHGPVTCNGPIEGTSNVYLDRSGAWRWQAGHELGHVLIGNKRDWRAEMFAEALGYTLLAERSAADGYGRSELEVNFKSKTARASTQSLKDAKKLRFDGEQNTPALYPILWSKGMQLEKLVGLGQLAELAGGYRGGSPMDPKVWASFFALPLQNEVLRILEED